MEKRIVDVYSKGAYPADALSNFYAYDFNMDGVACASLEGFLQALKYRDPKKQAAVCALTGIDAKNAGAKKRLWKLQKRVWWQGKAYGLFSDDLQMLIDRAYRALYDQSAAFRQALKDTEGAELVHTIGRHDMRKTILTEYHFIRRLEALRRL